MKNTVTKIFAIFALAGIVIGVIGAGVLFFMTGSNSEQETKITKEQLDAIIASSSGAYLSGSSLSGASSDIGKTNIIEK